MIERGLTVMSRITSYGSQGVGSARPAQGTEKTVGAAAAPRPTDNAERSVQTDMADIAAKGAPIDEARVAALRDALANGSYVIDVDKLAAKMIELDLGIPGAADQA